MESSGPVDFQRNADDAGVIRHSGNFGSGRRIGGSLVSGLAETVASDREADGAGDEDRGKNALDSAPMFPIGLNVAHHRRRSSKQRCAIMRSIVLTSCEPDHAEGSFP
jgi:hypothetical protein